MEAFQVAGAIAGFVAVILSIGLNLRQLLAVFARRRCVVTSDYHGPADLVGFSSKPRFILMFENPSAVSMDFRHFELLLPRLEGVVDDDGQFVAHPGAKLFKDGSPLGSSLRFRQEFRKIDFVTRSVRVEPQSSEVEFFELDAFLPGPAPEGWQIDTPVPSDFEPVLQFRHAAGQEFHCNQNGIHSGPYRWPFEKNFLAVRTATPAKVVELRRSSFLRRWSVTQRDADIEPSDE